MNPIEETIDAMLDPQGHIVLSRAPQLPPGPIKVTIRTASSGPAPGGVADVVRKLMAKQAERGHTGRSAEEIKAEREADAEADAARDEQLDAARRPERRGAP